jgi:CBS domain-containing protein
VALISDQAISDAEFLAGVRKSLYEHSRLLSPGDTLASLQDLKLWVGEELAFEEGASASFGRILSELWLSEYLDQLPPLLNKFERLASAYFVRRGSVTAFHDFCSAWREGVLRRILSFAEEGLELNDPGHPPVPYALLASGSLGRREQSFEEADRYFLVWTEGDAGYFEQFAYRIMAILDQCGLVGKDALGRISRVFWRGSLDDWDHLSGAQEEVGEPARHLELLSDLRHLSGDESIGREAVRIGRRRLERYRDGDLLSLARAVTEPAFLSILGGIRVEKSGEHVGCFNLVQSGLNPLVAGIRLLAMQHGLDCGPTLSRLAALLSLGELEEDLAGKIESAYRLFAGLKIGKEIALEQPYLDPSGLAATERDRLKAALETVRQLQRVVRRALLGKDQKHKIVQQG